MRRAAALLAGLSLFAAGVASAQSGTSSTSSEDPPNFPRTYQYDQPFAGWLELNLWTSGVVASNERYEHFDQDTHRQGLVANTFEAEYGVTDRLTLGGYLDVDHAAGGPLRYVQGRLLARYRFSNRQDLFVNPGVYLEYYIPRSGYGDQELEARFILDKDLNDFRLAANPRLSFTTTGPDANGTPSPGLDLGVYYRRSTKLQPGLEYHGDFGRFGEYDNQKVYIEPTVDISVGKQLTWHLGAAAGLTKHSDKLLLQSILTLELNAIRPRDLFGRRGR